MAFNNNNSFLPSATSVIIVLILASWHNAIAQQAGNSLPPPDDPAFLREQLGKHTIRANSKDDENGLIPEHVYYLEIFSNIIFDPKLHGQLSPEDWKIISELPSHNDARFASLEISDIRKTCETLARATSSRDDLIGIAVEYDSVRKNGEDRLDKHYDDVLRNLSATTRQWVESMRIELTNSERIGYASLDLSGLASETPDVARKVLERGCDGLSSLLKNYPPRVVKIIDLPTTAIPFDSPNKDQQ